MIHETITSIDSNALAAAINAVLQALTTTTTVQKGPVQKAPIQTVPVRQHIRRLPQAGHGAAPSIQFKPLNKRANRVVIITPMAMLESFSDTEYPLEIELLGGGMARLTLEIPKGRLVPFLKAFADIVG